MSTTKNYCIGTPGQPPRMFVTCDDAFAQIQLKSGEVYFYQANYVGAPHAISADGKSLVAAAVPLTTAQAAAWQAAKLYRKTKLTSGITTPKGIVQSDRDSRNFIGWMADDATRFKLNNQTTLLGLFKITSGTWSINFRMSDNSVVTHNGDDMIAVAAAVKTFDMNCQAASDAIRAKIFSATTVADVQAVDVTSGYPT